MIGRGTMCRARTLAFAAGLAAATAASAQQGGYLEGAERIDIGNRYGVEVEKIAALSCLIDAGQSVAANRAALSEAIAAVDRVLPAMRDGDAALGLNRAEEGRKVLSWVLYAGVMWEPFKAEAQTRLGTGTPEPGPDYVSRHNLIMMHAAKNLVSEVISAYSIPPALLQNDAFTLQFVARQRTLSQQIAKEACGIITGNTIAGNPYRLRNAIRLFDASHQALQNGFPALSIDPAPAGARALMAEIGGEWTALKADLDAVAPNGDPASAQALYDRLSALLTKYEAVVPHYVEDSKSGI